MGTAVVTTSINEAPSDLEAWSNVGDLFVAGDENTPPSLEEWVTALDGRYVPAEHGRWWCSRAIGWRSIQRRNIAILEAILSGADTIITVDDDNRPLDPEAFDEDVRNSLNVITKASHAHRGVFDPGSLCDPPTHARGLPYTELRHTGEYARLGSGSLCEVAVVASLWMGDPDVDAVERLANAPVVNGITSTATISCSTYAPLNSQATSWEATYAPLMAVLPGVGRMDDIWSGYIAQRIMRCYDKAVHYGRPLVVQDRNEHDLVTDLERELIGYRYTSELLDRLDDTALSVNAAPIENYEVVARSLAGASWFPEQTLQFMDMWVHDVKEAT
jgi:hypothetical protein